MHQKSDVNGCPWGLLPLRLMATRPMRWVLGAEAMWSHHLRAKPETRLAAGGNGWNANGWKWISHVCYRMLNLEH